MNVATMTVNALAQSGVKRIYGLIGDSLNAIGDAVRLNKRIQWIPVRHEEAAAFAAGAEAFLTGTLTVCAGTCGPGSLHLLNGLYEAARNESPVLALVTHIPVSEIGTEYFQETNPATVFKDCSVFCETVMSVEQMPRLLQSAMQAALAQKGVAVLIVPSDVAKAEVPVEQTVYCRAVDNKPTTLSPAPADIEKLAQMLNSHGRITLYCGIGCRFAKDEVLTLAQRIKSPIVHTIRSKDFMENGNPFDVGLNGYLSSGEPKTALESCDLLLLLGTDYPYRALLPTAPDVVQIDTKAAHLGRRSKLTFGIKASVKAALTAVLPLIAEKTNKSHLTAALAHRDEITAQKRNALVQYAKQTPLRPEYLTAVLNDIAPDNAVFAVDVGLNDVWAARYLQAKGTRRIIGSFKHGTMAAALSAGIGAFYAMPRGTPVIVLAGDGGLSMLLGELLTVIQNHVDLKVIVYNNQTLGFIDFEAKLEKIPPFKTELVNPDFAELARTIGFKTVRIKSPDNLKAVLTAALNESGAVLIDAVTDPAAMP